MGKISKFSELSDLNNRVVRTGFRGMRLGEAFLVSIVIRPDILLMEELLSVGDEKLKHKAEARFAKLFRQARFWSTPAVRKG